MPLNIVLLLFSTAIWGFGFIATRWTFQVFDPMWTNALRFLMAGILCLPFLIYKKSFTRKNNILKEASISAAFLVGAILFQTIGLKTTTVAKSGFITTLYALFIPFTMMVILGAKFRKIFWALIILALIGMALMCNLEITNLNIGDFFTLLCAISAAFQITYIGKVASSLESAVEFNFLQNFFGGIFSVVIALIFKGTVNLAPLLNFKSEAILGLIFLGTFSSMISFTIQVIAQKKIPAHIAGLIFLLESPFAAIFAFYIFHETLSPLNILGAGLIMLSVVLATWLEHNSDVSNLENTN